MNVIATAHFFQDTTDRESLGFTLNSKGNNKQRNENLEVKEFELSNDGILKAVLYATNVSKEIMDVVDQYPSQLTIKNENELHINTTTQARSNNNNNNISFTIPGSEQGAQITSGISIDRKKEADIKKEKNDIL